MKDATNIIPDADYVDSSSNLWQFEAPCVVFIYLFLSIFIIFLILAPSVVFSPCDLVTSLPELLQHSRECLATVVCCQPRDVLNDETSHFPRPDGVQN